MGKRAKLATSIYLYANATSIYLYTHTLQLCFGQRDRADCVLILHLELKHRSCSIPVQPPSK